MNKTGILDVEKKDVFDLLRKFIDKNIKNGSIQPKIFIRDGFAYRFVVKLGDAEFSYEIADEI